MDSSLGLAGGQGGNKNDLLEQGQQIRFQYADHERVLQMKPYINIMKEKIIHDAKKRKLKMSGTAGGGSSIHSDNK